MTYEIETGDIQILRDAGVSEDDITHCVKVAEKSREVAGRTGAEVDMALVVRGALFHDLGKAETHEIGHGRIGAEMGERLGLAPEITAVMEKHIRGGLTEEEAVELGLPVKDYTLGRLEERIIIYADRLIDIITEDVVDIGGDELEAERRFEEILRDYEKYGKNKPTLVRYLGYHDEIQGLMNSAAARASENANASTNSSR
ncbi:MAG: HDIG domain-containing protein [Thermoleophilia bacterium]|nr:HDIG domain-containing protein [Thermoleophilia bacterium]